jgi:phage FluMu protein Com
MSRQEEEMTDASNEDPEVSQMLDGNAVGGMLAALFGADMTAVPGRCTHCRTVSAVAELRAFVRGPGTVLRCPKCSGVVMRIVETPDSTYVDARGAAYLRFERR